MSTPKELHFFSRRMASSWGPLFRMSPLLAKQYYSRYFRPAKAGQQKGEITPAYGILPAAYIKMIKDWMPELKIIFMMRNPVDRSWSQLRKDFAKAYKQPISSADPRELIEFAENPIVALRSDYPRILDNWLQVYPAERFLFLDYAQVGSNPSALLHQVEQFLELSDPFPQPAVTLKERVNARPASEIPAEVQSYLKHKYAGMATEVKLRIGVHFNWE